MYLHKDSQISWEGFSIINYYFFYMDTYLVSIYAFRLSVVRDMYVHISISKYGFTSAYTKYVCISQKELLSSGIFKAKLLTSSSTPTHTFHDSWKALSFIEAAVLAFKEAAHTVLNLSNLWSWLWMIMFPSQGEKVMSISLHILFTTPGKRWALLRQWFWLLKRQFYELKYVF